MQWGQFVNTLEDDVLAYKQKGEPEKLLNKQNLEKVWNLDKPGEYLAMFPDDVALTHTVITPAWDSGGRMIMCNDTVIVKFDQSDVPLILDALANHCDFAERLRNAHGDVLCNPLPEVKL